MVNIIKRMRKLREVSHSLALIYYLTGKLTPAAEGKNTRHSLPRPQDTRPAARSTRPSVTPLTEHP
jgi:hypothetical protein